MFRGFVFVLFVFFCSGAAGESATMLCSVSDDVAEAGAGDRYTEMEEGLSALDPAARGLALKLAEQLVVLIAGERSFDVDYRLMLDAGGVEEFVDELQILAPDIVERLRQELVSAESRPAPESALETRHSSIRGRPAVLAISLIACVAAFVLGVVLPPESRRMLHNLGWKTQKA